MARWKRWTGWDWLLAATCACIVFVGVARFVVVLRPYTIFVIPFVFVLLTVSMWENQRAIKYSIPGLLLLWMGIAIGFGDDWLLGVIIGVPGLGLWLYAASFLFRK